MERIIKNIKLKILINNYNFKIHQIYNIEEKILINEYSINAKMLNIDLSIEDYSRHL
jgi:hypothetical protein